MRRLYLYLHTHWDREWYLPFESFRVYLKSLMQVVCHKLETGDLPSFYLDGQACALEDAVELDLTLAPRIRALMQTGCLSAGPWYVLADQMLVCGESLIANLKLGIEAASKFGTPTMIGYCPDTFGHSQDLPRILAGFGINTAVVWRGVPQYNGDPVFWWVSPDGSRVLAYHLSCGYYQTMFHEPAGTQALMEKLLSWVSPELPASDRQRKFCNLINGVLLPVGGDHLFPPFGFLRRLTELRRYLAHAQGGQIQIETVSLEDFLKLVISAIAADGNLLKVVSGELRDNSAAQSHARAYLLSGVLSSRLYLKRANRLTEHRLSRIFVPLCTLLSMDKLMQYPASELEHAWKLLLKNQPHDSICGTSIDPVHEEMMVRMHGVNHVLDSIETIARDSVGRALDKRQEMLQPRDVLDSNVGLSVRDPDFSPNRLIVYNLSSQEISQPVFLSWCSDKAQTNQTSDVQVVCRQRRNELFYGPGLVPYYKEVDLVDGWVWAPQVPPLGFKEIDWPSPVSGTFNCDAVSVRAREIDNGLISAKVTSDGSIVCMVALPGGVARQFKLGHDFLDVGDGGDTYNFDPLPDDEPVIASVSSVAIGQPGPLVGSIILTYKIKIPKCIRHNLQAQLKGAEDLVLDFERSRDSITHYLTTEISLRRGVPILFFETTWENRTRDHRLEVLFDTGAPVEQTYSENHFSVVTRQHVNAAGGKITSSSEQELRGAGRSERGNRTEEPPEAETEGLQANSEARAAVSRSQPSVLSRGGAAGSGDGALNIIPLGCEAPPNRFPCQRFFVANGQLFLNVGLPEYGAIGSSVSLTVLRSVSKLSRGRLRTRGGGAGPHLDTPGALCLGANHVTYGWAPLATALVGQDKTIAEAYQLAEQFEGCLWAASAVRSGEKISRCLIKTDNPFVHISALYRGKGGDEVFLRLLNVAASTQVVRGMTDFPWQSLQRCSLNGISDLQDHAGNAVVSLWQDSCQFELTMTANELATIVFRFQSDHWLPPVE